MAEIEKIENMPRRRRIRSPETQAVYEMKKGETMKFTAENKKEAARLRGKMESLKNRSVHYPNIPKILVVQEGLCVYVEKLNDTEG